LRLIAVHQAAPSIELRIRGERHPEALRCAALCRTYRDAPSVAPPVGVREAIRDLRYLAGLNRCTGGAAFRRCTASTRRR
jgi:hypothetical protein